jgi:hypothetical protein
MAEEKETLGQMNATDECTNDASSLSPQVGPRTSNGKERSKYNAVKHGIFSKVVVLEGEPRGTFDRLLSELFSDLQPVGELERILVEKIAILVWRYRRLIVTEAKDSKTTLLSDADETRWNKDNLLRYEASIERAFDRALTQLERKQRMRLGQPILPPIKLDLGSA